MWLFFKFFTTIFYSLKEKIFGVGVLCFVLLKTDEMKKKHVIISSFEPFDGFSENSSQIIAESISLSENGPFKMQKVLLPVVFETVKKEIPKVLKMYQPSVWLALGQAKNRDKISLERMAQNIIHIPHGDNDKKIYLHKNILKLKPTSYFLQYPWKKVSQELSNQLLPFQISYYAGNHLCNALSYLISHAVETQNLRLTFAFVHLPLLPEQKIPSAENFSTVAKEMQIHIVQTIINTLCRQTVSKKNYLSLRALS